MKLATINTYGQTGLNPTKLLELEQFIEYHCLDIVCLQETNVSESTFSECNYISRRFQIFPNNSRNNYGTCILVDKNFSVSNVNKDVLGRFICLDIDDKITVANIYLQSGTDQASRNERENFISDIVPNLMIYKKQAGFICGDFNCITDRRDSLVYPDQKMSKCLKKLVNLYQLSDVYRKLYPHSPQYSRYYTWRGVKGATRLDRIYSWGEFVIDEAEYVGISFSDHLAHIAKIDCHNECEEVNPKKRNIYKVKHYLAFDEVFLNSVRNEFPIWVDVKYNYSPVTWWEYCVKPNIKKLAIQREKEINTLRRQELEALQLKLNFYLNKVKNTSDANYENNLSRYEVAKKNLQSFYQERSKIILFQNRAEIFNMSDTTRLYHFESLKKYIKSSWISKIEVDGIVYSDKHNIEEVINNKLEASLSQSFVLDVDKCNKLFSFNIPKIDDTENILFCKDISLKELRNALRQLRASASPGR